MERLERTAVQLWEARRLAAHGDVPRGRLALLLLDNAAETMLRRMADTALVWADLYGGMLRQLDIVDAQDEKARSLRAELEERALSRTARRRIERDFNALVDYVFRQEDCTLDVEYADCLKILHRYRNAAYHRDSVRADVLGSAIQIYFYLCCHLLKNQRFVFDKISVPPPGVLEVFEGAPPTGRWPRGRFTSKELGNLLADRFLADMNVHHVQVAAVLSQHLTARIATLEEDLDEITSHLPPSTRAMTLRLVQLAPTDPDDLQQDPPEDFWTRPIPVTQSVLDEWKADASKIREERTAHSALRAFAAIEESLVKLEEPVATFIQDFDRAIQMRIDELRGK